MPNASPRLTYNSCQVFRWINSTLLLLNSLKAAWVASRDDCNNALHIDKPNLI